MFPRPGQCRRAHPGQCLPHGGAQLLLEGAFLQQAAPRCCQSSAETHSLGAGAAEKNSDATLPLVDLSHYTHTNACSEMKRGQFRSEQMPQWPVKREGRMGGGAGGGGEGQETKVHYLYLLKAPGCPVLSSCNTQSSTLILIMWLIN